MAFSPDRCPNPDCSQHHQPVLGFRRKSFYRIQRLNQWVRRFQCKTCNRTFSSRTFKPDYQHKKMDLNNRLADLLIRGNTLRDSARMIGMTYKNTYNKYLWLTTQVALIRPKLKWSAKTLQFDEMETIHHTKCKPLSIALMVNENYQVLSAQVAEMPAKGRLAAFSRKKYGPRTDERDLVMEQSFGAIKMQLAKSPEKLMSDAKASYRKFVINHFPNAEYEVHSRVSKDRHRDRLHEKLKKREFDPIFALNQRCALLRASIRRLARRSWCTTKRPENLQGHLDLFIVMQAGYFRV